MKTFKRTSLLIMALLISTLSFGANEEPDDSIKMALDNMTKSYYGTLSTVTKYFTRRAYDVMYKTENAETLPVMKGFSPEVDFNVRYGRDCPTSSPIKILDIRYTNEDTAYVSVLVTYSGDDGMAHSDNFDYRMVYEKKRTQSGWMVDDISNFKGELDGPWMIEALKAKQEDVKKFINPIDKRLNDLFCRPYSDSLMTEYYSKELANLCRKYAKEKDNNFFNRFALYLGMEPVARTHGFGLRFHNYKEGRLEFIYDAPYRERENSGPLVGEIVYYLIQERGKWRIDDIKAYGYVLSLKERLTEQLKKK